MTRENKFSQKLGFTLIELLLVVAVIGILATVVTMNYNNTSTGSRDAQRQADLRNLQQALEAYKNRYGRYPEQCTPNSGANGWSGQIGTDYECDDANKREYIEGSVAHPFREFIPVLPTDPKLPSGRTDVGYVYTTNAEGSVYKIMAMNTVEADELLATGDARAYTHPFKSCDITASIDSNTGVADSRLSGASLCYKLSIDPTRADVVEFCKATDSRFQHSYALWGGYAELLGPQPNNDFTLTNAELYAIKNTADIICK